MISRAPNKMIVAVEGCCHGSLSAIYDTIHQYESNKSTKVDLLLICGDFQALRSEHDFPSLAVPPKYYSLGTFHQYYSGAKRAPLLTIVIGGNHEASNYMWELYHGGWLAENIYYLGAAGSVIVNGLRIAGASGIYKDGDYNKGGSDTWIWGEGELTPWYVVGRFETVPYNHSTMRSTYHTRKYDITRLMRVSHPPASS
jgi:lariat debranching enzyme